MQGQSGIVLDLNGDGKEDLVIGAPYAQLKGTKGALLVYLGTAAGLPKRPSALLGGDGNLGWSLAALGDANGDGKGDFAAGAFSGSAGDVSLAGTVTVYQGGDEPQPLKVLTGENALDKFGYVLASGDLNGDGIADLIVGAPFHSPEPAFYQRGAVYVYFGPDYNSFVKIPATAAIGGLGFSLAAGDLNGDGVDDLFLQATGKVVCYYGSKVPKESFALPPAPNVVFTSVDAGFGKSIAVLGNGYLAVGADQATIGDVMDSGRLFIINGSAGGTLNADALAVKVDGESNCGRFGSAILPLGDLGGGTRGLAVSAVHADGNPFPMTGKIFLFSLTTEGAGVTVTPAKAFPGEARDMHLGSFLALAGNGERLVAGAPGENANTGRVRLFDLR
jgi:hypothetical protein